MNENTDLQLAFDLRQAQLEGDYARLIDKVTAVMTMANLLQDLVRTLQGYRGLNLDLRQALESLPAGPPPPVPPTPAPAGDAEDFPDA